MTEKQQRVVLITGSGRKRVGFVIARHLARQGFSIALHYHSSAEEAEQSANEIRGEGVECDAFRANVADEAEVDQMINRVVERFGRLDGLVTTASVWDATPLAELTADDLRRQFDINTLGTFLCARRAGLIMCKQEQGGSIVTIGDWAIDRPYLDHMAYFISKGTIPTLTRGLAVELGQRNPNVRVNCIHPGPVMLPPGTSESEKQERIDSTLTKNADNPESMALAVQALFDNPFITGVCLPVDGGRTIFASDAAVQRKSI